MSVEPIRVERAEVDVAIEGRTLCDLLARNAEVYADQPALSWKEDGGWRTLSWADCRDRVAEAAMGLRARDRARRLLTAVGVAGGIHATFRPGRLPAGGPQL